MAHRVNSHTRGHILADCGRRRPFGRAARSRSIRPQKKVAPPLAGDHQERHRVVPANTVNYAASPSSVLFQPLATTSPHVGISNLGKGSSAT